MWRLTKISRVSETLQVNYVSRAFTLPYKLSGMPLMERHSDTS
jgi:hypothetical protein